MARRGSLVFILGSLLFFGCERTSSSAGDDDLIAPIEVVAEISRTDHARTDVTDGGSDSLDDNGDIEITTDGDGALADPDVFLTVDADDLLGEISPYIYGTNQADLDGATPNLGLVRAGGNRWTAYNWENNASNAGSDWFFNNDSYLGGGDTPAEALRPRIQDAHDHDASFLLTIPIQGYVAADKDGTNVLDSADHLTTRFNQSVATKGSTYTLDPDLDDGMVYQDEFVHWVNESFPDAAEDATRAIFYSLDNEPALWSSTHEEIHPDPVTYQELISLNLEYAAAVKSIVPNAKVFGFVGYGWGAFVDLQGASDASIYGDFIDTYLAQSKTADDDTGHRLIDVLDLHWYPEAQGGGVRIINDDNSPEVVEARLQAPRSLWDPTYVEDSWIAQWGTQGPIALVPQMKEKIASHYPGTRLSFSEYNYGGYGHISGALAQADVLGVFGREGVFAAALWEMGGDHSFHYGAFAMFRNYDGQGGRFGDLAVEATSSNIETTSVYASTFADDPASLVVVVVNKAVAEAVAQLVVHHSASLTSARRYRLTSASPIPTNETDVDVVSGQATFAMPGQSVTTLVFEPQ